MPSRFEPCGLNQMYSLRYGTLPIVRATGGLADTVQNYDEATGGGTGFVFKDLTVGALANTVGWAVSTFHDRPQHMKAMRQRAMAQDFSWERAAADYEQLYLDAYARRRKHPFHGLAVSGYGDRSGATPAISRRFRGLDRDRSSSDAVQGQGRRRHRRQQGHRRRLREGVRGGGRRRRSCSARATRARARPSRPR